MPQQAEVIDTVCVPTAHDHSGCHEKAIQTGATLLSTRGSLYTDASKNAQLIWKSHRAVKAYDLLNRVKPKAGTAKPAPAYRPLYFLLEQGLIHKVESLNGFIGCSFSAHQHESLLLTCVQCHEVEKGPSERTMEAIAKEYNSINQLMDLCTKNSFYWLRQVALPCLSKLKNSR